MAISEISRPTLPELDYEFATKTLGIPDAELEPFIPAEATGTREEQLAAAFVPFLRDYMVKSREDTIKQSVLDAFWQSVLEKATVIEYPEALLAEALREARSAVTQAYESYGYYYYHSLEEFMVYYFGEEFFPNGVQDAEEGLLAVAEHDVKYRLLLRYIANTEGWGMTPEEEDEAYAEELQLILDYFNSMYGGGITEADVAAMGYTRDTIIVGLLQERIEDEIYEVMRDLVTFE